MCGLSGIYIPASSSISSQIINNISGYFRSDHYQNNSSLFYRGPDEQLVFSNEFLAVNFCRLTIFNDNKLVAPYKSSCGRDSTLMNGEIYSVRDKISELNLSIENIECDSQILAEIYSKQGLPGFVNLHGMFAGYIYDNLSKSLTLVRDHFGQKPLYYYHKDDILLFSSHLNDILLLISQLNLTLTPSSDYWFARSIFPWLSFPNSPYLEIDQLPAGSSLTVNYLSHKVIKYFDPSQMVGQKINTTGSASLSELADMLRLDCSSVFHHGEVSKSLIVSGGWDSTSIPFILQQQHIDISNSQLFSLELPGRLSSKALPKIMSSLGENFTSFEFENNDEAIRSQYLDDYHDIFDHSIPYSHYLFESISRSHKVAIGGDGPDELLLGYDFPSRFFESTTPCDVKFKLLSYLIKGHSLYRYSDFIVSDIIDELEIFSSSGNSPSLSNLMSDVDNYSRSFPFPIALKLILLKYNLPLILAKVDTSSMHNSVEARTPYLSPQFVCSCLTNTLINAKQEFFKYLLPERVHQMLCVIPKEGFSPSSNYKKSQISISSLSDAMFDISNLPGLEGLPLFKSFYFSALEHMPGLQRLNSLLINN